MGSVARGRLAELIGTLSRCLLHVRLLLRLHLCRTSVVPHLQEVAGLIGVLLLERLLRGFHAREVELVLRAAAELERLRAALNILEKGDGPGGKEHEHDGDGDAARDDSLVLFRTVFQIIDGFLYDHTL